MQNAAPNSLRYLLIADKGTSRQHPLIPVTQRQVLPCSFSFIEKRFTDVKEKWLLNSIQTLRYEVWKLKGMDMGKIKSNYCWGEEADQKSYLLAIFNKDRIAGTGRMTIHENIASLPDHELYTGLDSVFAPPIASLNRIVVHPDYRRLGIGKFLVTKRIHEAIQLGAKSIACDCPAERAASMNKMGFCYVGRTAFGKIFKNVKFHVMKMDLTDESLLRNWRSNGFNPNHRYTNLWKNEKKFCLISNSDDDQRQG